MIVQATGTGKTRVAISLTDVLMRAGWVKRVLFLCDRDELRKQAKNAFSEFLKEPLTILDSGTQHDRNARIYLATYPAIDGFFLNFDPGFFDLLIADESHRSIYNHYRDLFRYFDCLQVGLTATPVEFISRNSFQLFDCGDQDPTFNFDLDEAVASTIWFLTKSSPTPRASCAKGSNTASSPKNRSASLKRAAKIPRLTITSRKKSTSRSTTRTQTA